MSNNIFRVNFRKLAFELLPTFCRTRLVGVFLLAALKPLERIHGELLAFRAETENRMSYNSQVFSLRKMLNDKFDPNLRRITIAGAEAQQHLMLYRREELKPKTLGRVMLPRRDMIRNESGFIVYVPLAILNAKLAEIKAWINYYRLPTKIPIIKPK